MRQRDLELILNFPNKLGPKRYPVLKIFFPYLNLTQNPTQTLSREVALWACHVFTKVFKLCFYYVRDMTCEFSFSSERKLTFCANSTSWWLSLLSLGLVSSLSANNFSHSTDSAPTSPYPSSSLNPLYQPQPWHSDFFAWPVT